MRLQPSKCELKGCELDRNPRKDQLKGCTRGLKPRKGRVKTASKGQNRGKVSLKPPWEHKISERSR